ncbi:hypothetical protein DERF_009608 [Dermatophagoides farinae]|uniref:Transmembrane protein n=1 Tax=Dermatophagoides farinae TaxID=6954 RepID=A0A922HX11_DERFA|nr:hypothetical protein DERF_009608 [Dermatophagoides farinae]
MFHYSFPMKNTLNWQQPYGAIVSISFVIVAAAATFFSLFKSLLWIKMDDNFLVSGGGDGGGGCVCGFP